MKTVSILISNYNSYEALQLCIESVQKYTEYPYKIIVCDAKSDNKIDHEYLKKAEQDERVEVVWGNEWTKHGATVDILLNHCDTDLAMILDSDIEILDYSWLKEMIDLIKDDIILISNVEKDYKSGVPSLPDWFQSWFMMLNMNAYKDGMQTSWLHGSGVYNGRELFFPTGGFFWAKLQTDNPMGYKLMSIPDYIQKKYHHFAHVSILGTLAPNEPDLERLQKARDEKFSLVCARLTMLRKS